MPSLPVRARRPAATGQGDRWWDQQVVVDRTRFHVRRLGIAGDLVLLLHGWPQDGSAWRAVAPRLVEAGLQVAAPDLKGFGRTRSSSRDHAPETLADEVARLVRALGVRRATVVGHDLGGAVALATAFRHPGRVGSLVLAASPYRRIDLRHAWHVPLLNLPVTPELVFRHAARPVVAAAIRHAAVVQEPFTPGVVAAYAAAVAADPAGWLRYYRTLSRAALADGFLDRVRRGLLRRDPRPQPPRLRMPVLVVWGERDPVTPLGLGVGVARDLRGHLTRVAGVGHFLPEEAPDALADAIVAHVGASGA